MKSVQLVIACVMSSKSLSKSCQRPGCKARGQPATALCADCFDKTVRETSDKLTYTLLPDLNIMKVVKAVLTEANQSPILTFKDKDWHRRDKEGDFYQMVLEYCEEFGSLLKHEEEKEDYNSNEDQQPPEEPSTIYQTYQEQANEFLSLLKQEEEYLKKNYASNKDCHRREEEVDFFQLHHVFCKGFGLLVIQRGECMKKHRESKSNFQAVQNVVLKDACQNLKDLLQDGNWHRHKKAIVFYETVEEYCKKFLSVLNQEEEFLRSYYDSAVNLMKVVKEILTEVNPNPTLFSKEEEYYLEEEDDDFFQMIVEYFTEFLKLLEQEEEFLKKHYESCVEDKRLKLKQNKDLREFLIKQNSSYTKVLKESTDTSEKQHILQKIEEILELLASEGCCNVDTAKIKKERKNIKSEKGQRKRKCLGAKKKRR